MEKSYWAIYGILFTNKMVEPLEKMNQVLVQFGDIEPFLVENSDVCPATQSKLLKILQTPQELIKLKVKLAAVIDVGQHFVKSTYNLEGDGLLSLNCYEEILKIRSSIHSANYPNVQTVIQKSTSRV